MGCFNFVERVINDLTVHQRSPLLANQESAVVSTPPPSGRTGALSPTAILCTEYSPKRERD